MLSRHNLHRITSVLLTAFASAAGVRVLTAITGDFSYDLHSLDLTTHDGWSTGPCLNRLIRFETCVNNLCNVRE